MVNRGFVSGTGVMNDMYSSVDGRVWQLETEHAGWPARAAFGLVKKNNKLFILVDWMKNWQV